MAPRPSPTFQINPTIRKYICRNNDVHVGQITDINKELKFSRLSRQLNAIKLSLRAGKDLVIKYVVSDVGFISV